MSLVIAKVCDENQKAQPWFIILRNSLPCQSNEKESEALDGNDAKSYLLASQLYVDWPT